jgi:hypothetical protein
MAYMRNDLISRRGYSGVGVGDWWDDVQAAGKSVLQFYGQQQQAAGAAAASAQANRDLATALAARQGIGTETILIVGGAAAVIAFLLLRKKH